MALNRYKNIISTFPDDILEVAVDQKVNCYFKKQKNGSNEQKKKSRLIEESPAERKFCQKILAECLVSQFSPPKYCTCCKGSDVINNAKVHCQNLYLITLDIDKFFNSIKEPYIKKYFESIESDKVFVTKLVKLVTYNGHLQTGSPCSPILSFLVNKELFDEIDRYLTNNEITWTLYMDDIALSSNKPIPSQHITFISKILSKHKLKISQTKTKRFNLRKTGGFVTKVYIKPNGELDFPFSLGYSIVKTLKEKNIEEMNIKETKNLIGRIAYLRQINNVFNATWHRAINHLKKLANPFV